MQVLPGFLFLGSYDNASRTEVMKALGITHILNVRTAYLTHTCVTRCQHRSLCVVHRPVTNLKRACPEPGSLSLSLLCCDTSFIYGPSTQPTCSAALLGCV